MSGAFTAREALADLAAKPPFDALTAEDKAWHIYAEACWNPLATVEQRRELFDRALKLTEAA